MKSTIWINELGQEVYPPQRGNPNNFKEVRPQTEWQVQPEGVSVKSWAEIMREQQQEQEVKPVEPVEQAPVIDEESRKALKLLKSKGLI